ncbi:Nicotinate-nucleotide-dimethylbenzimidazole phosphoribosyltransferase [Nitrospina gracilis 3/211]|uniref:Nicotinate-nucleotide--dimethylbenzimidazole phosphoribosyltransferase n=1 Tax=Nitrospina gracilis (strain 3/211) TaxID=1266370 RepID=M1YYS8_NITG3|nr:MULTISPECIES: nicotinate-nucleotide--dimethylbenzimidazole phosphoribosyltransferase [Nitrospina]MCF8723361.1 nicotinate-nucleotide--dimethylbenzimidazole phosphoribosyltransferase [Nitrospina sp. Nb-3]CCQ90416.1 Nicotinate-nucleotide-dimethylbenzimidazole phosphoribosyltransferase [Nitrospina gracilis 3/211]
MTQPANILTETLSAVTPVPNERIQKAQAHLDSLTKPQGSLGRLEEIAARLAAMHPAGKPRIHKRGVFLFAADHGVVAEGISAYPQAVTAQMVCNFLNGGAAINVLSRHGGAGVTVIDMGVNHDFASDLALVAKKIANGTGNIRCGPAMTCDQAERALMAGVELAAQAKKDGFDLLGTGDMGIGNTTPSAAILSVLSGRPPAQTTGHGTGIDNAVLQHKIAVIEDALRINQPDPADPVDVLAKVGGFEIAGIAGLCIGAASQNLPVVLDGVISIAGAAIAHRMNPNIGDYLFASHNSIEPGCRVGFDLLSLDPLLDFKMRLGEGTGSVLAMHAIEAAVKIYNEMTTVEQAGVASKSDSFNKTIKAEP